MPIIKEVEYGQDNSIDNVPTLTPEELDTLKKKQQAFDKLLADEGKAKYKIEVMFKHTRRLHGLSAGMLSIWESGARFHGGGDTKAYWCPGRELKVSDCDGIIPDASAGYGYLVCPKCQQVWQGEQVIGEIFYRLDSGKWADVLVKHFIHLNHNADIYLKYPKVDLRRAATAEQEKQLGGEKLTKARGERQMYIYPLKNILKDTANGADLRQRFLAFLTA